MDTNPRRLLRRWAKHVRPGHSAAHELHTL
jgi:hypothetical protein